jgi:hypothetical protein
MASWRPLLAGTDAVPVWQAIAEISAALRPPTEDGEEASPSVAGGAAGQALFFAYLALHRAELARSASPAAPPGADLLAAAEERVGLLLDRACDALAAVPTGADLYAGFSGVGWTVEHLQAAFLAAEDPAPSESLPEGPPPRQSAPEDPQPRESFPEDPNTEIDEAVLSVVSRSPWTSDYDLIRGLTGMGVYALERLPRPSAVACLEAVVERLAELAETGPEGVTWFTLPELLAPWQREVFPAGVYNLGVAHGMPAVIGLLAAACAAGVARDRARPLLAGAVRWLLAHRLGPGSVSCFPFTVMHDAESQPARLAWCYGDPGVAATLLAAGIAAGEPAWMEAASEIARTAAARPAEGSGVVDAGLCHGSAGVGHLFNRMFQATGDPVLRQAALRWLADTLARREPGEGLAGWRAFMSVPSGERRWMPEPGFLEGVAGIGLALLAAVSPVEPAWDRLLMASVRSVS